MARGQQERGRGFCWTINNPNGADHAEVALLADAARYLVVGNERGSTGTLHLQGYVYFDTKTTELRVRSLLKRAHVEHQRGTHDQAIDYCKKDGDFREYGNRPNAGRRGDGHERWTELVKRAECGDLEWIKLNEPREYVRSLERFRSIRRRDGRVLEGSLEHEWWYGPTGVGKSRTLWELYPNHYGKELNKWWCGYDDQEVVAIEEWAPKNECTASFLKIWADRYPFTAQIKGGTLTKIRPKKIIVLSNYTIDQCFPNTEDAEPLKRRFTVRHFPAIFTPRNDDVPSWISDLDNHFLQTI